MASALLGKLKSRLKGHHVFQSNYTIGDNFVRSPEPDNRHSKGKNAIIVKKPDEDAVLGHVPDALSQIICPMLKDGTIIKNDWRNHRGRKKGSGGNMGSGRWY